MTTISHTAHACIFGLFFFFFFYVRAATDHETIFYRTALHCNNLLSSVHVAYKTRRLEQSRAVRVKTVR